MGINYFLAPSDTPQNVVTVALSPTSIEITFVPPPEINQNGPITSYNISYTGETFDNITQFVTVNITDPIYPAVAQVSSDLTELQEYNNYTINVSAINRIGTSGFTAGVIQITNEGGLLYFDTPLDDYNHVYNHSSIWCSDYHRSNIWYPYTSMCAIYTSTTNES